MSIQGRKNTKRQAGNTNPGGWAKEASVVREARWPLCHQTSSGSTQHQDRKRKKNLFKNSNRIENKKQLDLQHILAQKAYEPTADNKSSNAKHRTSVSS